MSTTAASVGWSVRSSIADSPLPGWRLPPSRSFASLDPEISSCLSKPFIDTQDAHPGGTPSRVYWESILVVLPMYSGYAALFGLQHELKTIFGIQDDSSVSSSDFSVAVSCLYFWSFTIRIAQNVLLSRVSPWGRAFMSAISMLLAMLLIAGVVICESHRMCWVACAYSLGGIGIGCFDSNFLTCITPLGHETKRVAIIGIPTGITLVNVGGFFLMGPPWGMPPLAVYCGVAASIAGGMLVMALRIPGAAPGQPLGGEDIGLMKLLADVREFRAWLPQLWHYALAFTIDMFALVAFCPGVVLYVYNAETVTLSKGLVLPTNTFIAVVSIFNLLGGVTGRWLSYRVHPRHPSSYGLLTLAGIFLILQWVPLLTPLGTFLVMIGDGLIYGSISRHIDSRIPRQFNLIAISVWLLIGDVGSMLGSNLINAIRYWTLGGL